MEGKSNGRSPSTVRYVANGHANGVANHRTDRNLILQAENNGVCIEESLALWLAVLW